MTVSELIRQLEDYDGDSEVMISAPSHDYWGTQLANEVRECDIATVRYSEYHRTNKVVEDDSDSEYENTADDKQVVLIG